eukprot:UN03688
MTLRVLHIDQNAAKQRQAEIEKLKAENKPIPPELEKPAQLEVTEQMLLDSSRDEELIKEATKPFDGNFKN